MKGGLSVDQPSGERWRLAIELLDEGRDFVLLGEHLQLARHHGWPGADDKVHIAVLTPNPSLSPDIAQQRVDDARSRVDALARSDPRFRATLEKYGVVWEYAGDDGSATWLIAPINHDGRIRWGRS